MGVESPLHSRQGAYGPKNHEPGLILPIGRSKGGCVGGIRLSSPPPVCPDKGGRNAEEAYNWRFGENFKRFQTRDRQFTKWNKNCNSSEFYFNAFKKDRPLQLEDRHHTRHSDAVAIILPCERHGHVPINLRFFQAVFLNCSSGVPFGLKMHVNAFTDWDWPMPWKREENKYPPREKYFYHIPRQWQV